MEIWSVIIDASKLKYVKFISWDIVIVTLPNNVPVIAQLPSTGSW